MNFGTWGYKAHLCRVHKLALKTHTKKTTKKVDHIITIDNGIMSVNMTSTLSHLADPK